MKIKAIVWQEGDVWCGSVPALPGCHPWGESYEHLLEMLKDAIESWLEVAGQESEADSNKTISLLLLFVKLITFQPEESQHFYLWLMTMCVTVTLVFQWI